MADTKETEIMAITGIVEVLATIKTTGLMTTVDVEEVLGMVIMLITGAMKTIKTAEIMRFTQKIKVTINVKMAKIMTFTQ